MKLGQRFFNIVGWIAMLSGWTFLKFDCFKLGLASFFIALIFFVISCFVIMAKDTEGSHDSFD